VGLGNSSLNLEIFPQFTPRPSFPGLFYVLIRLCKFRSTSHTDDYCLPSNSMMGQILITSIPSQITCYVKFSLPPVWIFRRDARELQSFSCLIWWDSRTSCFSIPKSEFTAYLIVLAWLSRIQQWFCNRILESVQVNCWSSVNR